MLRTILVLLFMTATYQAIAQKVNDTYLAIASDGRRTSTLTFLSDSTAILRNIPSHSMVQFNSSVHKYIRKDSTIVLCKNPISKPDSLNSNENKSQPFDLSSDIELTAIKDGFINWKDSAIYFNINSIDKRHDLTFIINGKSFYLPSHYTDGYSLLRKTKNRDSRALKRSLKKIDATNSTLEIVKGINAYLMFGMKYVCGIILITTRNNKAVERAETPGIQQE